MHADEATLCAKQRKGVNLKKLWLCLVCILILMFSIATIYADTPPPPPTPWHRDLGNGLVFHYRPEYDHYHPNVFMWGTPSEFEAQGYPQTGLYQDEKLIYYVFFK